MKKKRIKGIPKYHGFRIYFFSTLLYFILVMPIVGVLSLKYSPEWFPNSDFIRTGSGVTINVDSTNKHTGKIKNDSSDKRAIDTSAPDLYYRSAEFNNIENSIDSIFNKQVSRSVPEINNNNRNEPTGDNRFMATLSVLLKLLLLSFLAGLAYNLPFKIFFKKKRKGKPIQDKLFQYCKKFLIKSPTINSLILLIPYAISLVYTVYTLLFAKNIDQITARFYIQYFFISLIATILTIIFVYYWQKHRVQIKYIEHVFTGEELRKRIFNIRIGRIRNRLWVSSGMTTLLPLIIVIFYLFLSITSLKDIEVLEFTDAQLKILFGNYMNFFSGSSFEEIKGLFYINAFDSALLFGGIFTGIFTSFIYIFLFIRWTTEGIVGPVRELLANMQLTGQGELDQFSIVRTNDEIGELTEGFNEMSQKLQDYFESISRINKANSRFVPRQFIEFLGKNSIADVQLGDQVQKEMTILFSDIRDFTTISEVMTPKENFDFLNNYLGYMEPVIRNNHGFIDKFMGDSIMAIFSESPEDAINAAIEMRIKLQEFNQVMGQFGKPPIDSGIGIHTGMLMLGIVGGEGRMDGTVISDAVNLASRIEGLTKIYGGSIIISEDTLIKLNDPSHYNFRFIDIVKVKGKREAVYVFEIIDGESSSIKALKIETKEKFGKALQHYKNKNLEEALKLFKEVCQKNKFDKASGLYTARCQRFIRDGIPKDWDGIEVITEK
ncbi:MAG: adenylate/guanylate cyclase domain-containing protein [Bacteroidetes bacterium]|nr:adenylate/guanylate cyclase domain-containing protein [Bacteroidota bacterium]